MMMVNKGGTKRLDLVTLIVLDGLEGHIYVKAILKEVVSPFDCLGFLILPRIHVVHEVFEDRGVWMEFHISRRSRVNR